MLFAKIPPLVCAAVCLAGAGCGIAPREDGNQMMLVRETPGTTGYRRLMAKSEQCGDLKIFIGEKGLPDFVAEANSSNREYLIFYYLDKHQAFACRSKTSNPSAVEFAGPYPMTNGEWKLLTSVKKKADGQIAAR